MISNCVINLAPDKRPVFAEIARVLRPGGRVAISDVVADALRRSEYLQVLSEVGLVDATIEYTHDTDPGPQPATVRAVRPPA